MDHLLDPTSSLFREVVLPVSIAVVGWLVKDVIFGLYRERQADIRAEWTFRLREVYSPLLYWSGVIQFRTPPGSDKLGVKELGEVLERGAHLIPQKHYWTFVQLVQHGMGQSTTVPSVKQTNDARDYVYSRIEMIAFALYKSTGIGDLSSSVDHLMPIKLLLKSGLTGLLQLTLWLLIVLTLYALVLLVSAFPFTGLFLGLALLALFLAEFRRRSRLYQAVRKRLAG